MTFNVDNPNVKVRITYITKPNGVLPISRSAWYKGISDGIYPSPCRLGPRISVWDKAEIDSFCDSLVSGEKSYD